MIRINLLEPRASMTPEVPLVPRRIPKVVFLLALSVAAVALAGYHHQLQQQEAAIGARLGEVGLIQQRMGGEAGRVEALEAQHAALAARVALLEGVGRSRLDIIDLLEATSHSVPDGVWLTRLTRGRPPGPPIPGSPAGEPRDLTLEIEGRAVSIAAVTDLADALEATGVAGSTVEVVRTTTDGAGGAAPVAFTLLSEGRAE